MKKCINNCTYDTYLEEWGAPDKITQGDYMFVAEWYGPERIQSSIDAYASAKQKSASGSADTSVVKYRQHYTLSFDNKKLLKYNVNESY